MASQNQSHKSRTPNPLESPRTNPLEITRRKSGEVNSRGLSVHFGVHGKIRRSTPNVAHKVTSNKARRRQSQMCNRCFFRVFVSGGEPAGKGSPDMAGCSSDVVRGGIVFGSAVTPHSRNAACCHPPLDWNPSGYFTS